MKRYLLYMCVLLLAACKEKYVPNINEPNTGYLVVEGFINSGSGPTTITLSRTTKLSSSVTVLKETKAIVRVENKAGNITFPLTETSTGVYTHPQLTLSAADQYRVYIKTTAGREYVSDYSSVRRTPDIDSISWKRDNTGVQLYANSHDPQNNTKYYLFKYEETWEFTSKYVTNLKIYNDRGGAPHHVGYRDSSNPAYDQKAFRCWKTNAPANILLYSTEKFTQDVVSQYPITAIEPASWKLSILYSVNFRQYALSVAAYRFYEQMRKNTEQLGSIFDAQPSESNGNLHCLGNAAEIVIGFVEVSEEKQKRIFISNAQVPDWAFRNDCEDERPVPNIPDSVKAAIGIPTRVAEAGRTGLDVVYFAPSLCVDCTLKGVNVKPAFWP